MVHAFRFGLVMCKATSLLSSNGITALSLTQENAKAAMEFFDGSAQSVADAVAAIDGQYAAASEAVSGEFLLQLYIGFSKEFLDIG